MREEDHPNFVRRYDATPEELDRYMASTASQAIEDIRTREFLEEWPVLAVKVICRLAERVATLEARLAQLEAPRA